MARISVLGGTGYAGSGRREGGRPARPPGDLGQPPRADRAGRRGRLRRSGPSSTPTSLDAAVAGHDVVIEAVSPRGDMAGKVEGLVDQLIELTPSDRHPPGRRRRRLVAAGRGGRPAPVRRQRGPTAEVLPEIETGLALLETLKARPEDVDWFYVSPPAVVRLLGAGARHRQLPAQRRRAAHATTTAARRSRRPTWRGRSSTRSSSRSTAAAGSTPRTDAPRQPLLDDDLDALELLELGVAGRRHRPTQRADQVHRAVGDAARAEEDLLERCRRCRTRPARRGAARGGAPRRPSGSPGPGRRWRGRAASRSSRRRRRRRRPWRCRRCGRCEPSAMTCT